MGLRSKLFKGDARLEACLVSDASHILRGARGDHVGKIQQGLALVGEDGIAADEIEKTLYGGTTEATVLRYKTKRNIINRAYQSRPDAIVGKMTLASLDGEVLALEDQPPPPIDPVTPAPRLETSITAATRDVRAKFAPEAGPPGSGGAIQVKLRTDRQFAVTGKVTLLDPDCFIIGALQTLFHHDVHANYRKSATGTANDAVFRVSLSRTLPLRDHSGPTSTGTRDWQNVPALLGPCAGVTRPGDVLPAANPVSISFGDDPGGIFPLSPADANRRDQLIREIVIEHDFVTWLALRRVGSDPKVEASYFFVKFFRWTIRREFVIVWVQGQPTIGRDRRNELKIVSSGAGRGPQAPVLVGPDVRDVAKGAFV